MLPKYKLFTLIICLLLSLNSMSNTYKETVNFNGELDDIVTSFHFDDKNQIFYFLNTSLVLHIIDLTANTKTEIQINITNELWEKIPKKWAPRSSLNTGDNLSEEQNNLKLKKKLSEIPIVLNNGDLFLTDDGGGLTFKLDLSNNTIDRVDNSFVTMNKFHGDLFSYDNSIYHFGGYGLYTTNSTLLRYNEEYKIWDEILVKKKFPLNNGISRFTSLITDNKYYVIGGSGTKNQEEVQNTDLIYFDFLSKEWINLGEINYDYSPGDIFTSYGSEFYIYNNDQITTIDVSTQKMWDYSIKQEIDFQQTIENITAFNSHYHKPTPFINNKNNHDGLPFCDNLAINYFTSNNSVYNSSILRSYKMNDFIEINSKEEMVLFQAKQNRNEFFIPAIIIIVIVILNLFYTSFNKQKENKHKVLYTFEDGKLLFNNTEITIDNNTSLILYLLTSKEKVTSNDIVALLVENGMSFDYASKIKNKSVERLNERFEFITGSSNKFIETIKSTEDKRIQILKIIS